MKLIMNICGVKCKTEYIYESVIYIVIKKYNSIFINVILFENLT